MQPLFCSCLSAVDHPYQAHVPFSFTSQMCTEHRKRPETAAAVGRRRGMGNVSPLRPALLTLALRTWSFAILTQLGPRWLCWWRRTDGPSRGVALCRGRLMGRWCGSWSITLISSELKARALVFCNTMACECSVKGEPNKSYYSSLEKRSQIFLKKKRATSGHR